MQSSCWKHSHAAGRNQEQLPNWDMLPVGPPSQWQAKHNQLVLPTAMLGFPSNAAHQTLHKGRNRLAAACLYCGPTAVASDGGIACIRRYIQQGTHHIQCVASPLVRSCHCRADIRQPLPHQLPAHAHTTSKSACIKQGVRSCTAVVQ